VFRRLLERFRKDPMNLEIIQAAKALRSDVFPNGFATAWLHPEQNLIKLVLPFPAVTEAEALIAADTTLSRYSWNVSFQVETLPRNADRKAVSARNVIAIASGKGGVGKSSVTASLALALAERGARVGILDADIFGPSMPTLFGAAEPEDDMVEESPDQPQTRKMNPVLRYGVAINSLGYLTAPDDATVWRGPMASRALEQLCFDTRWPQLDYLLVDLPPGTGDIQLTLAQKLPVTGALVVTTPQEVALADARKAISMFNKVDVPVFGVLENMSFYQCSGCGNKDFIFGEGGGNRLAAKHCIPLLGEWPLNSWVRACFDAGKPSLVHKPEDPVHDYFRETASRLVANAWLLSSANAEEMN